MVTNMKKKLLSSIISVMFAVGAVHASPTKTSNHTKNNEVEHKAEYQQVVDDYKKYLSTVSKDVLHEIKDFRTEVEKLRQHKKDLYSKLSQEAQAHLAKEKEFKKKLPKKEHSKINNEASE